MNRTRRIFLVTLLGSVCNALLLSFKALAGFLGHSPAMIADAIHSLSDFVTDIFVLFFVKVSSKPQDDDHAYGHGKYETIASSLIGISLLIVGFLILKSSVERIWLFANGESLTVPSMIALYAALTSIVIKEALFWYTIYYARKLNSSSMKANAWHHRSDAFSSIATLVGIGGAILLGEKWAVLDPIAALIVSGLIIRVACLQIKDSFGDLVDKSIPQKEKNIIMDIIAEFNQVSDPHNLRTRHIGTRHNIEMHIRMDGDMTVRQSHEITKQIEQRIITALGQDTIVTIHVEPTVK